LGLELLDRGLAHITAVDASSAYITAARTESPRRGQRDVVEGIITRAGFTLETRRRAGTWWVDVHGRRTDGATAAS
jgi:hypothetical protein